MCAFNLCFWRTRGKAVNVAIDRIKRLILERTKEGDTVIIAGIGNTIGIGQ